MISEISDKEQPKTAEEMAEYWHEKHSDLRKLILAGCITGIILGVMLAIGVLVS